MQARTDRFDPNAFPIPNESYPNPRGTGLAFMRFRNTIDMATRSVAERTVESFPSKRLSSKSSRQAQQTGR
jgi:hypothetical protein